LRWFATAAAVLCAVAAGGCSYQLHSFFSKDDADVDQTGSIGRPGDKVAAAADAAQPPEGDLAYARAAALDVLAHGGRDLSVPWQNPQTGAGGNITPLASSYSEGGLSCRDFLASYVLGESQSWLQGAACHSFQGAWEVKSLRPLKSS
jgi:surface antigen